jgi:putative flippase GtrA
VHIEEALDVANEPRHGELKRFLRFTGAGIVAAIANVLSRMAFSHAMRYSLAVAAAYLVGMAVAFTLTRMFVFDETENPWQKELIRFAIVNAAAFVQVELVSLLLAAWLFPRLNYHWHTESVAHMVGVGSPIISSYFGHKHFSFRS